MGSDIANDLIKYINEELLVKPYDQLEASTLLLDAGILDSFGIIELVNFLERTYQVTLSQSDLNNENFGSVNTIAELLNRLR